jgi:4-hydroxythreonine-4-phosphate dehydrogenase
MPRRWLILADDLTGAADCAIAFARQGMESVATWGAGTRTSDAASVLSVNVDSRHLPPRKAAERQVAAQAAHWRPGVRLYKKIDSTLRGQPAAELAAQLSALAADGRAPLAVVAPAFPAAGRVTLDGRIEVGGLRLEDTPLWTRQHTYLSAALPDVLASAGLTAEVIPLDLVRAGSEAVHARMEDAWHRGVAAMVCDCIAEADLGVTAVASLLLTSAVWVGSAGLAGALAALVAPARLMHPALPAHPGGVLTVVGSPAEISRLQARMLVESGLVRHVVVTHETLLAGPQSPGWRAARDSLSEGLMAGRDVLLEIAVVSDPDLSRGPEVVAGLAALVTPVAKSLGALVATGGETACALLSGFGIHAIRLLEEVEPGVPLGVTLGALSFPVVTKAGGFGNADTLRRCLARLRS